MDEGAPNTLRHAWGKAAAWLGAQLLGGGKDVYALSDSHIPEKENAGLRMLRDSVSGSIRADENHSHNRDDRTP